MLKLKPHLSPMLMLRLMLMPTMVTMDMADMVLAFLTIHMPLPALMLAIQLSAIQLTAMDFMDTMDTSARGLLSLMVLLLLGILLELLGTQAMLPAMLGILIFITARGPLMLMLMLMLMPIT